MQLSALLPPEHVVVPLEAASLRDAIRQLVERLEATGALRETGALEKYLAEPRLRDLASFGPDVALPHFRTDAVSSLVAAVGVSAQPLDARDTGLDAAPHIVFLLLAPPGSAGFYLQTLSTLARVFRNPETTRRLAEARRPEDVLALNELSAARVQPRLTVRDLMISRTESVPPDATVREAIDAMLRQGMRAVPVVGDKGEVLGIVSDRDLVRALLPRAPRAGDEDETAEAAGPTQLRVRDIMSRSVLCISEDTGLDEVANMLVNKDVEQLPIVTEGRFSGSLTRGDIIRKLFAR
jgi:CBS domain-containing protein/mannitol/fructose-specific phosphotransferase system IIA component (Ntr-type)